MVEQDGLCMVPCEPDMFNSNRSDVIEHGLPMVCSLYHPENQAPQKFYACSHKVLSGLLHI